LKQRVDGFELADPMNENDKIVKSHLQRNAYLYIRLARNNADWHRMLEICALTDTLIADEDGLYDPNHFNDRLVLGLRGTMSEAELHFLRARLEGGKLNKARRGELRMMLPPGLVYDAAAG
jgi:DNA invertase Pin-like site-specific DNA recombinase